MDSALKTDENYYPQVFLKECKYTAKKGVRHIHDKLCHLSLLMSVAKNELELVKLVFQKIISQTRMVRKQACCIFKTMFKMH